MKRNLARAAAEAVLISNTKVSPSRESWNVSLDRLTAIIDRETAADNLRTALKELVRCVRGGDKTAGVTMDGALIGADEALKKAGAA